MTYREYFLKVRKRLGNLSVKISLFEEALTDFIENMGLPDIMNWRDVFLGDEDIGAVYIAFPCCLQVWCSKMIEEMVLPANLAYELANEILEDMRGVFMDYFGLELDIIEIGHPVEISKEQGAVIVTDDIEGSFHIAPTLICEAIAKDSKTGEEKSKNAKFN